MKSRIIRWSKILTFSAILGAAILALLYQHYVVSNPGTHLKPESIDAILATDTRIYYSDGVTPIGSVFDERHRFNRIYYDELPTHWVQAITAAEDQRFFNHFGLDPVGILRAIVQNITAGRIVSGASTLTQQTAKNLYYRTDRDLRSKLEEALNALRLESHYSKEEILAFYANQIHVRGNGRGLGVASRYFFDKEISDLGLLECAFLAGMVKGPDNYNPFIGDETRRKRSLDKAQARVGYVLSRMRALEHIDEDTYQRAIQSEIPFKNGSFRFASNVVVDAVEQQLKEEPFLSLLEENDIQNLSSAGLSIVTTIDEQTQRYAWYGLRHHLSDIGASFEAASLDNLVQEEISSVSRLQHAPPVGAILYAQVSSKQANQLTLDLGGHSCEVDKTGLQRMADIIARAKNGRRLRGKVDTIQSALSEGDVVIASVRDEGLCDLELRVALNGAVLAMQQGQIRVMVGGVSNRDLNRALTSKRQLGSTWKTMIYTAALQLGWSPTDMLDNRPNGFLFERVWYTPSKAHRAEDVVSMTWAGVNSENLASVWLLAHLTDQLSGVQLRQVVEILRLDPQESESRQDYILRIRDALGVISTSKWLEEVAFMAAKREWLTTAETNREKLEVISLGDGRLVDKLFVKAQSEDLQRNAKIHYPHLLGVAQQCEEAVQVLLEFEGQADESCCLKDMGTEPNSRCQPCQLPDFISLFRHEDGHFECGQYLEQTATSPADLLGLTNESEIWLEGRIRLSTIRDIENSAMKYSLLLSEVDPYDIDFLIHHPDFLQIINMRYVSLLAQRLGIEDELQLTLSMPLGALDISLLEGVNLYSGLLTGQQHFEPQLGQSRPVLISQIVTEAGREIYSAELEPKTVSDSISGILSAQILHNVVEHGTGRRANGTIKIGEYPVPAFGKTGTTNAYKNAAFLGAVPAEYAGAWSLENGLFIGVYVGYDEPKSMRRGSIRGGGSNAALPVWVLTAQGAAKSGLLGALSEEVAWKAYDSFFEVPIETTSGLPNAEGKAGAWIYDPDLVWGQEATHARRFAPVQFDSPPLQLRLRSDLETDTDIEVRILSQEEDETVSEDVVPLLFPGGTSP